MLLEDDLFSQRDSDIIGECTTFIAAATQTLAIQISNAIYYITRDHHIRDKLKSELFQNATRKTVQDLRTMNGD